MNPRDLRQFLTALLLGLGLSLSSVVLADHFHDNLSDEINCETCSVQATAIASDTDCEVKAVPKKTRVAKERPRIPFETFRLGERPRGPPLH